MNTVLMGSPFDMIRWQGNRAIQIEAGAVTFQPPEDRGPEALRDNCVSHFACLISNPFVERTGRGYS